MSLKAIRFSLIVLAATSASALAATTQADADRVRDALKPYFGQFTDVVKITPLDDGFKAVLDFSTLLNEAKKNELDFSITPIEFTAKPAGGNLWKLHRDGDVDFTAKLSGGSIVEKFIGYTTDATLDLGLGLITESNSVVKSVAVDEDLPSQNGLKSHVIVSVDGLSVKTTAKPNADGGSDIAFSEPLGPFTFTNLMDDGQEPIDISGKAIGGTFDGMVTGFKGQPLLELWKFAVAHTDKKPTAEEQGQLKAAMQAELPVFKTLDSKGSIGKFEVTTPLGVFSADKLGFLLKANGLVREGFFQEAFNLEGLTIPVGLAPAWSTSLVPKNVTVDFRASGFDLGTFSNGFLEAADFSKDDPVSNDIMTKLQASILPGGILTVAMGPSSISNSMYNLSAEGSFVAGPAAVPSGKAKIKLKGFDDVMKAVNGAPAEAGLKEANAVLIVAKGLGKSEADGSITWDIEAKPDGQVLVNGTDVKKLK